MTPNDRSRLARDLHQILSAEPELNKYHLESELYQYGWRSISTSDINSVLYSQRRLFKRDDDTPPNWHALGDGRPTSTKPQKDEFTYYCGPPLRDWQREAFDAWKKAGRRGVVEAVTGTGKTAVGIVAAADAASRDLRTYILVPTRDLLDQWHKKLTQELPALKIGRFGDGWQDSLRDHHVIVGTVQSSCRYSMLPPGYRGLLVADEVHRYGAAKFSLALELQFEERLGLTATYEREDNGIKLHLTPYFTPPNSLEIVGKEVVAVCSYARGLNDGILAHFRVGLLGVDFTAEEQSEYDELDKAVRYTRNKLIREHDCPEEPFGEFMKAVTVLSEGNHIDYIGTNRARQYLNAFSKRKSLLADCHHKIEALKLLEFVLRSADRAIVFTETVDSAEQGAEVLKGRGVLAEAYTSKLNREERKRLLLDFREGRITVLAAPRVLDEGIDVPEADVGVIVAASRSRRQMVQRMGRIIRPKKDNRSATFIILYVRNTSEDPDLGAHDEFLSEMMDNADEVETFYPNIDQVDLLDWHLDDYEDEDNGKPIEIISFGGKGVGFG